MDWWSIGILVYEMLAGRPPFNNKSRGQLQKQIMAAKLKLPPGPISAGLMVAETLATRKNVHI